MKFKDFYFYGTMMPMEKEEDIKDWCEDAFKLKKIGKYTINKDLSVDVDGDVNLRSLKGFKRLPVKFNKVTGYFDCKSIGLVSLQGSPEYVGNYFNCGNNEITSMKGAPSYVGDDFLMLLNRIKSLDGLSINVGRSVFLTANLIDNFHNVHKHFLSVKGTMYLSCETIKHSMLGLLLVKDLPEVSYKYSLSKVISFEVVDILNQYLPLKDKKDVYECQEKLIEADFPEYAKL